MPRKENPKHISGLVEVYWSERRNCFVVKRKGALLGRVNQFALEQVLFKKSFGSPRRLHLKGLFSVNVCSSGNGVFILRNPFERHAVDAFNIRDAKRVVGWVNEGMPILKVYFT